MWTVFAALFELGYMELLQRLGVEHVQDTVALFQDSYDMTVVILMAFTASIVAPVCEEIVFRGYLYPVMKKFSGPWIAALCNAMIFSAAHGSMSALLPLFIFGIALVALYEYTGSIWAPIAAHFLFNSATVFIQLMVRFGYIPESALQ
jgi:membrane protease YdiL (CAAX protease family)